MAVVTEAEAAAKPGSLTYAEAAAVPLAALTAWQSLISTARLEAGQTVLVHGGSGGVGSFAVQIAKARRESDRDRLDPKSGFAPATRRGRGA